MTDELTEVVRLGDVRRLIDRADVRAVVESYFSAVDRCDYDAIEQCFTTDADLEYDAEPSRFTGGREVADWMRTFEHLPNHTHSISNCSIAVSGDTATADTFGQAVLVVGTSGPGSVLVMGLRYIDELVRLDVGWRISKRRHILKWQYNAAAEVIQLPDSA